MFTYNVTLQQGNFVSVSAITSVAHSSFSFTSEKFPSSKFLRQIFILRREKVCSKIKEQQQIWKCCNESSSKMVWIQKLTAHKNLDHLKFVKVVPLKLNTFGKQSANLQMFQKK